MAAGNSKLEQGGDRPGDMVREAWEGEAASACSVVWLMLGMLLGCGGGHGGGHGGHDMPAAQARPAQLVGRPAWLTLPVWWDDACGPPTPGDHACRQQGRERRWRGRREVESAEREEAGCWTHLKRHWPEARRPRIPVASPASAESECGGRDASASVSANVGVPVSASQCQCHQQMPVSASQCQSRLREQLERGKPEDGLTTTAAAAAATAAGTRAVEVVARQLLAAMARLAQTEGNLFCLARLPGSRGHGSCPALSSQLLVLKVTPAHWAPPFHSDTPGSTCLSACPATSLAASLATSLSAQCTATRPCCRAATPATAATAATAATVHPLRLPRPRRVCHGPPGKRAS
ncbi:hypothetical protein AOQ84DRAFT_414559 [Glonium stellatum]|uniref:Uncharacterized protein n=1 Tax=Glonium stellatum TaxID=574774 RepID=A0A8E2EUE6_9PEZI|nr:hypothetical protein AOQ84DRAFT_414559 [Glonium stellatum]